MTPDEISQLRTVSEIARACRRQNEQLRQALGQYTQEQKKFDQENEALFSLVHENHRRKP